MVLKLRRHRLRRLSEDKKVKSFRRPFCAVSDGYEVGERGEVGNVMEVDK